MAAGVRRICADSGAGFDTFRRPGIWLHARGGSPEVAPGEQRRRHLLATRSGLRLRYVAPACCFRRRTSGRYRLEHTDPRILRTISAWGIWYPAWWGQD